MMSSSAASDNSTGNGVPEKCYIKKDVFEHKKSGLPWWILWTKLFSDAEQINILFELCFKGFGLTMIKLIKKKLKAQYWGQNDY